MKQQVALFTIVVADYDEAISFYTGKLGFQLLEDTQLSEEKRWVRVAPQGSNGSAIFLAKAASALQKSAVGNQTGGRVGFFLHTDDFERDYNRLLENGVDVIRLPETHSYGRVAVFADLYGNLWDLVEPSA